MCPDSCLSVLSVKLNVDNEATCSVSVDVVRDLVIYMKNKVYYGAPQVYYGKSITLCGPIRFLNFKIPTTLPFLQHF